MRNTGICCPRDFESRLVLIVFTRNQCVDFRLDMCLGKREGYGMGVDMFSVGCVVYTLLCGYEPFFGETEQELIENNKSCKAQFVLIV